MADLRWYSCFFSKCLLLFWRVGTIFILRCYRQLAGRMQLSVLLWRSLDFVFIKWPHLSSNTTSRLLFRIWHYTCLIDTLINLFIFNQYKLLMICDSLCSRNSISLLRFCSSYSSFLFLLLFHRSAVVIPYIYLSFRSSLSDESKYLFRELWAMRIIYHQTS